MGCEWMLVLTTKPHSVRQSGPGNEAPGAQGRAPKLRYPSLKEKPVSEPRHPQRVLFLCTHNSARSQMAEGLLRHLAGSRAEVFSAGTEATQVRPMAIISMAELGIDISGQESKTLERYLGEPFDYVITVCDQANETCPVFFGNKERLHWSFPDPSQATGTAEEQLAMYRAVRDAIQERIARELLPRLDPRLDLRYGD